MSYKLYWNSGTFMVVGCGGTGGYVAEGLCQLLIGKKNRIYLVDHDRVEEHNLGRQNFVRADLGRFKAQVLAERLSMNYDREVHYAIQPIEDIPSEDRANLTIGCVDNPKARDRLQFAGRHMMGGYYSYQNFSGWYIDAGNSEHSGQVLIGNALLRELNQSFYPNGDGTGGRCNKLPLPQLQQPALLAPQIKPVRRDCAEAVRDNEQSPVINKAMAALVLQFVYKLMNGELDWMGAYLDLDTGTLSTIPADPATVARMLGLKETSLVYHPRKQRVRVSV